MGAVNLRTVLGLLRPNVASLGYGLFLAINAASVWGGVFPFLPLAFQTTDVMLWFFGAESLAFTATFLASAAGTYFFPAETRHFMVKAVSVPYMGGWCLLIGAMYLPGAAVALAGVGGALLGVGSAGFYMLWQRLFASQDAREGMGNLIAGTAWAAVLYFALYLIPVAVTAYLIPCVFLPLFGLAVVLKSRTIDLDQPDVRGCPARAPAHLPPRAVHHLARGPVAGNPRVLHRRHALLGHRRPVGGHLRERAVHGGHARGRRDPSGRVGRQEPAHQRGHKLSRLLPRGDHGLPAAAASGGRLRRGAGGGALRAVERGHHAHDDPMRPGVARRRHQPGVHLRRVRRHHVRPARRGLSGRLGAGGNRRQHRARRQHDEPGSRHDGGPVPFGHHVLHRPRRVPRGARRRLRQRDRSFWPSRATGRHALAQTLAPTHPAPPSPRRRRTSGTSESHLPHPR